MSEYLPPLPVLIWYCYMSVGLAVAVLDAVAKHLEENDPDSGSWLLDFGLAAWFWPLAVADVVQSLIAVSDDMEENANGTES